MVRFRHLPHTKATTTNLPTTKLDSGYDTVVLDPPKPYRKSGPHSLTHSQPSASQPHHHHQTTPNLNKNKKRRRQNLARTLNSTYPVIHRTYVRAVWKCAGIGIEDRSLGCCLSVFKRAIEKCGGGVGGAGVCFLGDRRGFGLVQFERGIKR